MAIYAVGDIQGCYDPLRRLLDAVSFDPEQDRLWCVGDLVNRGPNSLAVLRYLKSLGDACICVLGNHDLHLLGQAAGERAYRRDTLQEVLAAPDGDELVHWLRHLPLLHHDENIGWCMVHAGLHPHWTLSEAIRRASDIETTLRGDAWHEFCRMIHHQQFPDTDPESDGVIRQQFSLAVMTRARYCTADGRFNWETRAGEPSAAEEKPWFAHSSLAWRRDCRIVYGHWAAKGLVTDQAHVLGLDSGCVWGGKLTAARLDGETAVFTQVQCEACQRHE